MKPGIAIEIIRTKDISPKQMVAIGREVNDNKVWKVIDGTINYDKLCNGEILELGFRAKNDYFWIKLNARLRPLKFTM